MVSFTSSLEKDKKAEDNHLLVIVPLQNSPNDLQMLSDAPAHHLFCLLPPVPPTQNSLPEVLAVVQVRARDVPNDVMGNCPYSEGGGSSAWEGTLQVCGLEASGQYLEEGTKGAWEETNPHSLSETHSSLTMKERTGPFPG